MTRSHPVWISGGGPMTPNRPAGLFQNGFSLDHFAGVVEDQDAAVR